MKKSNSFLTSLAGAVSAVLAFLGIVSCCGMPIIAGVLSMIGIGASQLSFFAEYRWWFLALSAICLAVGFYQVYGKKQSCCSCGNDDSTKKNKRSKGIFSKILLWIGAVLIVFVTIYNLSSSQNPIDTCCSSESRAVGTCCDSTIVKKEQLKDLKPQAIPCCKSLEKEYEVSEIQNVRNATPRTSKPKQTSAILEDNASNQSQSNCCDSTQHEEVVPSCCSQN